VNSLSVWDSRRLSYYRCRYPTRLHYPDPRDPGFLGITEPCEWVGLAHWTAAGFCRCLLAGSIILRCWLCAFFLASFACLSPLALGVLRFRCRLRSSYRRHITVVVMWMRGHPSINARTTLCAETYPSSVPGNHRSRWCMPGRLMPSRLPQFLHRCRGMISSPWLRRIRTAACFAQSYCEGCSTS
jgi:hypothetical protein